MSVLTVPPLVAAPVFGCEPWYAARSVCGDVSWLSVPDLAGTGLTWADDEHDVIRSPHINLTVTAVAEVLFCSSVDRADHLSPSEIWAALARQLAVCHCELALCEARLAQEAGDHPDESAARMAWCLELAAIALNPIGGAS